MRVPEHQRIVIVHSAWLGSWAYQAFADRLRELGNTVFVPELRGHGSDSTPPSEVRFADYVDDVTAALSEEEPSFLVGHSFGGVIASAIGEAVPERVRGIVYLAGFVLPSGFSFLDWTQKRPSHATENLVLSPDGAAVWVDPEQAHAAVAHDVPIDAFERAAPRMVPEPTKPLAHVLRTTDRLEGIPKYYVHTSGDRALPLADQQEMVSLTRFNGVATLDSSHVPNFSQPTELADALLGLIGSDGS